MNKGYVMAEKIDFTNMYDPKQVHVDMVKNIQGIQGDLFVDPNNSYALMLSAIGEVTTNAIITANALVRKTYPTTTSVDIQALLRHASADELIGLYASPASAELTLYVNLIDVLSNGIESDIDSNTKVIRISAGTRIKADGYVFTTVNDIDIHTDGKTSVVEQVSNNQFGFNRYGALTSSIYTAPDGGRWMQIDIHARQFDYVDYSITLVGPTDLELELTDRLWYITVDGVYDDGTRRMNLTGSDIVYDVNIPTIKMTPLGDKIRLVMPNIYKMNNTAPSSINVRVFTTKGAINVILNEFTVSDYVITRVPSDYQLVNVDMYVRSNNVVTGGRSEKTIDEIRNNIINNTTGSLIKPVTYTQLVEKAARDGYGISLYSDMPTHRLFTYSKNIDVGIFKDITSDPDIYINLTTITRDNVNEKVIYDPRGIIIKHHAMFGDNGGLISAVTDSKLLDTFYMRGGYTKSELNDILETKRTFFTPYTNVIHEDHSCRTYDLLRPYVSDITLINRNITQPYRININRYEIIMQDDTYLLTMELVELDKIDTNRYKVLGQIILTSLSGEKLYINSSGISPTDEIPYLNFVIPTTSYIDKDGYIEIVDTYGVTGMVSLVSEVTVMPYVPLDISTTTGTYTDQELISLPTEYTTLTGLSNHSIYIHFGKYLPDVFNSTTSQYTERKYKKHQEDVPYFYDVDVFKFEVDGCDVGEDEALDIVYSKGTIKRIEPTQSQLDNGELGEILYQYRIGDAILVNGQPVIDLVNGIRIESNIIMLETEYMFNRLRLNLKAIDLIYTYMDEFHKFSSVIGSNRLESTEFKYKPLNQFGNVSAIVDGNKVSLPQQIKPDIVLYVDSDVNFTLDKALIGRTIQAQIEKPVVRLDAIRDALTDTLGITAVSINSLGIGIDSAYINVITNQLTLKKKMLNSNEVEYDIAIRIQEV